MAMRGAIAEGILSVSGDKEIWRPPIAEDVTP